MADSYYGDGYGLIHAGGSTFWSCGYKYTSPNYMAVVSKSTDGGASWTRHTLYSGSQYGYVRAVAVDPSNSNNVWALGYDNSQYRLHSTANGGGSWSTSTPGGYTGTPYDLKVDPDNPSHLAAASSSGLYHSTNGGTSWTKVTSSFGTAWSLYQSDLLGGLVISTNAGVWIWEDWQGTPVHFGEDPGVPTVQCVLDTDDEHILAGTSGASVWRSYCGTGIQWGSHAQVDAEAQVTISPNPVSSPSASLGFINVHPGSVTVEILDLAGRRVRTLCSGEMEAGSHQLTIQTDELVPGVYFAVVRTESDTVTGRFVLAD